MALIQVTNTAHKLLSPSTVDTIQFLDSIIFFRIRNRSLTDALFYRVDRIDPSISGDGSTYLGPGEIQNIALIIGTDPEFRLIASGLINIIPYSIERV